VNRRTTTLQRCGELGQRAEHSVWRSSLTFCTGGLLALLLLHTGGARALTAEQAAGQYIARAAGCITCHTDKEGKGAFLAGGHAMQTPFGRFYSPNITPHPEHGIGRWSADDLYRALHEGLSPAGEHYYPVFPYTSYTRMRRADVNALWAWLQTVPPQAVPNRSQEPVWYAGWRGLLSLWKWRHFQPGEHADAMGRDAALNRGSYLAAIGHCEECHTPRNREGALDAARRYAGSPASAGFDGAPNITPDRTSGLGRWTEGDLVEYFASGARPDGDYAGSLMADVVDDGLRHLTPEDASALARFLRNLPPLPSAGAARKAQARQKPASDDY
jgi:mono/diheme cytochrome c family protein